MAVVYKRQFAFRQNVDEAKYLIAYKHKCPTCRTERVIDVEDSPVCIKQYCPNDNTLMLSFSVSETRSVADGDIFHSCNFMQAVADTPIMLNYPNCKYVECQLHNCIMPNELLTTNCGRVHRDYCSWLHPYMVDKGLPLCSIPCRHIKAYYPVVEVDGVVIDTDVLEWEDYICKTTRNSDRVTSVLDKPFPDVAIVNGDVARLKEKYGENILLKVGESEVPYFMR